MQVYPSTLEGASRMEKIARSLHPILPVSTTELVGVHAPGLPTQLEIAPGVTVNRIPGSNRPGNLGRVLRHVLWQPRVYRHYKKCNVAVVAAHNVWVLPLCYLISRRASAPLVYNPHELETETASMRGLKRWAARRIEAHYIRRCAVVSAVNDLIADWYVKRYDIDRPIPVPNLPEIQSVATDVRHRLGIPEHAFVFAHTGHLSEGRNIPAILDAFKSSPHHVVFFGDGPYRDAVLTARATSKNIHWHAPVPADQVVAHFREADAGLCLVELAGSLSDQLATPNKLMEALAADRPSVCSDFAEARRWLAPHADTWIVPRIENLGAVLDQVGPAEVECFRESHEVPPTWDAVVAPLAEAYKRLFQATTKKSRHI